MADKKKIEFKSGFVSIIGRPNVGKSTLLNYLLGKKLAPVSRKPQTTRQVIHGIRTDENSQMVFVDTPGLHKPKDSLGKIMVANARKAFGEADLVLLLIEPRRPNDEDERIIEEIKNFKGPMILAVNKVDQLADKQQMLPVMDWYHGKLPFKEIIPISALHGIQCDLLLEKVKEHLSAGPQYFPADMTTDQPLTEVVKEFIREKVVRFTGEELPYVTAVMVDEMNTRKDGLLMIRATVVVEKESQKGILIGKGGSKMKQIGQAARQDLEKFFQKRIFLDLWVKVMEGWKTDPARLKRLGYE